MKKIITLLILLLAGTSFAEGTPLVEAPFGLKWGQKFPLTKCTETKDLSGNLVACQTRSVPKPLKGVDFVYLLMYKGNLVKVSVYMKDISEDPYGVKGVEEYERIKGILAKKYGESSGNYEYLGRELYQESSEFYQCLNYTGCGMFMTFWGEDSVGQIALSLEGTRRGQGFLKIIYESHAFFQMKEVLDSQDNQEAEDNL